MTAIFPSGVKTFSTKVDGVDVVLAGDINSIQDEITALETWGYALISALAYENKVLGQAAPAATMLTALYTVPASHSVKEAEILVCNRGATATTFRISVAVGGEADATKQYLYYDVPIDANDSFNASIGLTLAAGDVVRCYAGNANLSFTLFGSEIS